MAEWNDTEKFLPTEGAIVLAYWPKVGDYFDPLFGVVKYSRRRARHELNCQIWANPENLEDEFSVPSHWMPLPDAPAP